jgi:hypothetical protein
LIAITFRYYQNLIKTLRHPNYLTTGMRPGQDLSPINQLTAKLASTQVTSTYLKKSNVRNQIVFLLFLLSACAKQSTPMGGPRDLDAPKVISIYPEDKSLNTKPTKIQLEFDEYIKLDNATKNIIITPRVKKDELIITALKNMVIIELNQELEDSTTYVFNFQNSIQDLSESNPADNLKLVFSTGPNIDSLELSGSVNTYFPDSRAPFDNILVGLYEANDTTDLFTAAPYYISQVDSIGNFIISNIKEGKYRVYSWKDENNTLKAEYKSELFDFISDTLSISENISTVIFNLAKGDQTPIRLLRSSAYGAAYDLVLNKNPVDVMLESKSLGQTIFYTEADKRIRLYSINPEEDSIATKVILTDSVGNSLDSLVWSKFESSDRKKEELTIQANSGKSFFRKLQIELTFNKPVLHVNTDSLFISFDTASIIPIRREMIFFEDSSRRDKLYINLTLADSILQEIFTLNARDSTFQDIENVFNKDALKANYKKLRRETLADEISGTILGNSGPYIVQLISKNEVKKDLYIETGNEFSFTLVEAGEYQIRVIADRNKNRRWDPGNFVLRRSAEQVFYFEDEDKSRDITIRAGWTVPSQQINSTPQTGFKPEEN